MIEKPIMSLRGFPYRGVARVALGVGLLAFVLPFATVSCGGQEAFTATGLNTITGAQYTASGQAHSYSGDVSFLLAALGGIVALVCQFLRLQLRMRALLSGLAALWSVVMLLVGQAHVTSEVWDLALRGLLTVRWGAGFWIALVAFGAGSATMALELFSARSSPTSSADSPAPPGRSVFANDSLAASTRRSLSVVGAGVAAFAASLMIVIACELPYLHYADALSQPSSPSVFNSGFAASNWFAAEPVGVAVLALIAGVVLVAWQSGIPRAIASSVLLAFGVQTLLLFLGYVVLAVKSPSSQLGPGGVVGMAAGALLFGAGLAAGLTLFWRPLGTGEAAAAVGVPGAT